MGYLVAFLVALAVPLAALLGLNQQVGSLSDYGDLTRIGRLSTRDFARRPPPGAPPLKMLKVDSTEPAVVVLGDSFSRWNIWQSEWMAQRGRRDVLTYRYEEMGGAACLSAWAGQVQQRHPAARQLIVQIVERSFAHLLALWTCSVVNLIGLRQAGRLQVLVTALKLLPLLLFGIVALWFVDAGHYVPFNPSGKTLPQVAQVTVILTMWALCGLEVATVPAGAIRDPARTIPRATLLGTLLAGIATILACTVVIGLVPTEVLRDSGAPMADAASRIWGPGAAIGIAALAAVSTFGAINGWMMVCGQVSLAAAGDGLFPRRFARLDRNGTPAFGILVGSMLATLLVIASYSRSLVELFTFILLISTSAILLPYAASSAAWLRSGGRNGGRAVAMLALLYSLYALSGAGAEALGWGAVLLLAGAPVYLWMKRRPSPASGV